MFAWLVGFNTFVFLAMFAIKRSKRDYCIHCAHFLWGVNFMLSLCMCISFSLLYTSPHSALNNTLAQGKAHHLLRCAQYQLPSLRKEWQAIDDCLGKVSLYNVSKGRVPFSSSFSHFSGPPTAFVYSNMDPNSIFATEEYQGLDLNQKALILIHECAHLGLGAVDHAYVWEPKYLGLSVKEHYENADSFMDAVFYHCI